MNQSEDFGKILKPWPNLVDHFTPAGQWTTDIWSRNDGFIANAGVRIKFG